MSTYEYQVVDGAYHLMENGREIMRIDGGEVAIAYDQSSWKLHKHGSPGHVMNWVKRTQETLRKSGPSGQKTAKDIVILQGTLNVSVLNSALAMNTAASVKLLVDLHSHDINKLTSLGEPGLVITLA